MTQGDANPIHNASVACPVCKKSVAGGAAGFPFCSTRCRQADLGRWLSGDYVISRPLEQADFEED